MSDQLETFICIRQLDMHRSRSVRVGAYNFRCREENGTSQRRLTPQTQTVAQTLGIPMASRKVHDSSWARMVPVIVRNVVQTDFEG